MRHWKGLVAGLVCTVSLSLQGAVQYLSGTLNVNQSVPLYEGTLTTTHTVSSLSGYTIADVNVSIDVTGNFSGGWNGDLYATLSYTPSSGPGTGFVVLLNRPGRTSSVPFGYNTASLNVTLDDSAAVDIHVNGGASTGSFQPDGRNVVPSDSYDTTPRTTSLASFNGLAANGTWTLLFSDARSPAGVITLNSWSLEIQAVPEPVTTALMILGGVFGSCQFVRYLRRRKAPAA